MNVSTCFKWIAPLLVSLAVGCGAPPPGGEQPAPDAGEEGPTMDADAGGTTMEAPTPGRNLPQGSLVRQTAKDGDFKFFARDGLELNAAGELELAADGGLAGEDTVAAGSYSGANYYNAGKYRYGTARIQHELSAPFDEVVPSYDVVTPPGTWMEVRVSARIAGAWTKDYKLGVWTSARGGNVTPHSVKDGTGDAQGDIRTDTLHLKAKADALRLTAVLFSERADATPTLRGLAAAVSASDRALPTVAPEMAAWGKVLPVPKRSQMIYPDGGEVWCSPTSTTMLLAYWGDKLAKPELTQPVPTTVKGVYDFIYNGHGNWAFNTAYGASVAGSALNSMVARLSSVAQLERLILAEIPVAISLAYSAGELSGSPITSTGGHLLVVKGFSATGDVICNDPAFGADATVEVTYKRDEFAKAWLGHSYGTTYVLWPAGTALPADPLGGFY